MLNVTIHLRSGETVSLEGVGTEVVDQIEDSIAQGHSVKHNTGHSIYVVNPRHIESVTAVPAQLQPY